MIFYLIIIILLLLSMLFYILFRIHNISIIKNINNKFLSWLITLIPILILVIFMFIDMINTVIVFLHIFLFLVILDLVTLIVNRIIKRKISYTYSLLLSLLITSIYLGYGYYLAHHVVETYYTVYTDKEINDTLRIVQITDSHIGATMDGDDFINYMNKINKINPDIVVVTGDFVDDDTTLNDMIKGCTGLGNLKTKYGVYYIYGNHDRGYFNYREFNEIELNQELERNSVIILKDKVMNITDSIYLLGRDDRDNIHRESIFDLTNNLDKSKYIITLDHQPNDYDNEEKSGTDLVLSGHTHGGQLFPLGYIGVALGINDNFYGLQKRNNTTFIVSSGIGDWAIKFKTGAISEYTVIDIKKK